MADLRASGRGGVAPFVTCGDGGLDTTLAVLRALDDAGAACVELGVPFSDPIADGPVLQAAAQRALDQGTDLGGVLGVVRALREESDLPVVIFSYANPLASRGWDAALAAIAEAGADGVLVPDLPVEEGGPVREAADRYDLCSISFVAPTTRAGRVRAAAEASRGFLYAIGRTGVTGARTELSEDVEALVRRIRQETELPIAVGFGIKTREHVQAVLRFADLAIIGSALVDRVHEAFQREGTSAAAARCASEYLSFLLSNPEDLLS